MRANFSTLSQYRRTLWLRTILTGAALTATCWSASVPAANIIVNSLLDDVLPDAAGNITPALAAPQMHPAHGHRLSQSGPPRRRCNAWLRGKHHASNHTRRWRRGHHRLQAVARQWRHHA